MNIKRQLHVVTNPEDFFASLVLGAKASSGGFADVPEVGEGTSPYRVQVHAGAGSDLTWHVTAIPFNGPRLTSQAPRIGSF
jgi:hypothetical protein